MVEIPTVRFFCICEKAERNPNDGSWSLHNIYHTAYLPKQFDRVEEMYAHIQLTDGIGEAMIGLKVEWADLANPKRNQLVDRIPLGTINFTDPWKVVSRTIRFAEIPIPNPGQYRFSLVLKDQALQGGEVYLRILQGE
ncbi:MAG: hypothetical protein R3B84_01550 [Zavarzinella sp.]